MRPGPREIAFAILLLAIPLGAWHFLFRPQNRQDAELRQQIEAKQERLRAVNQATAVIGDLHREAVLGAAGGEDRQRLLRHRRLLRVRRSEWRGSRRSRMSSEAMLTRPAIRLMLHTVRNLPAMISVERSGAHSSVCMVPRSFSPVVTSRAG